MICNAHIDAGVCGFTTTVAARVAPPKDLSIALTTE
jgi:hypothetical protein